MSAQLVGRASLIALWFWAGFHKLLIDFIKPADMVGFKSDVIPNDLMRLFPPERFPWSTHNARAWRLGWTIAIAETSLGLMCLIPAGTKNCWHRRRVSARRHFVLELSDVGLQSAAVEHFADVRRPGADCPLARMALD